MIDIVERLRAPLMPRYGVEREAADTIEALRAENAAMQAELVAGTEWFAARARVLEELVALRAENDAYREECSNLKNELAKWVNYWRDKDNKALRAENARLVKLLSDTNTYYAECIAEREDLKQETAELKRAVKTAVFADSAELRDCKAENARLREALKPFVFGDATLFELLYENKSDDTRGTVTVSLGELRAARTAMGESDD